MNRALRILLDLSTWRYGYVLGGRAARRHRWSGRVEIRICGDWKAAHATWRQHFTPF